MLTKGRHLLISSFSTSSIVSVPKEKEELVVRYQYQKAGVKLRLRYDTQLQEALELWK